MDIPAELRVHVYKFVAATGRCQLADLNPDMELVRDLGIYGDDADEFLTDFAATFNVDLSKMPYDEYFPSESYIPYRFVVLMGIISLVSCWVAVVVSAWLAMGLAASAGATWLCAEHKRGAGREFRPFKIQQLLHLAVNKRWTAPAQNGAK